MKVAMFSLLFQGLYFGLKWFLGIEGSCEAAGEGILAGNKEMSVSGNNGMG